MSVRFSDVVEIDTSGPLWVLKLEDGLYVVGQGTLMAVDNLQQAYDYIKAFK